MNILKTTLLAAALATGAGLAGCDRQVSSAEASAPVPEKKKSLARQAQMYSDQDMLQVVQSASVEVGPDGGLKLKVDAVAPGEGWSKPSFLPRIYAATPPDGIYEIDVIATKPATAGAATPTPVEVAGDWNRYTDGRVKGVRFMSKTNEVVAMVPAGS